MQHRPIAIANEFLLRQFGDEQYGIDHLKLRNSLTSYEVVAGASRWGNGF